MSLEIHVRGSPSRCPYCKEGIGAVRDVVACALCGARHHAACREEHGRCAVCSSVELLVYKKNDDLAGDPGLNVLREEDRVTYRWRLIEKKDLALVPVTGFLTLAPAEVSFLAVAARHFFEVKAAKAEVRRVADDGTKLTIEIAGERHVLATESIGYALSWKEVGVLADAVRAWVARR